MKKYLIFSIIYLIFICTHPAGAVKKIEANPINIAVILTQETDTAKIASTLDYYGYTPVHSASLNAPRKTQNADGSTVYTHPNGSSIRYKLFSGEKYPTIEVKSKASAKEIDKILMNLNFQKQDNSYERKSVGYITVCNSASHGSLIFTRKSKPKD